MRILKIKGKDEKVILSEIEKQYGNQAVILSTQKEEAGFLKYFKPAKIIVTIAVKDEADEVINTLDETANKKDIMTKPSEDEVTTQMLLNLDEKLKRMEDTLKNLERHDEIFEAPLREVPQIKVPQTEEESKIKSVLREKLLDTGIRMPLCEVILQDIHETMNTEQTVQTLYQHIEDLFVKNKPEKELPQTVFFVGSTGVGKTTTIAKLTAQYVLEKQKKVVLFTSDTYRIAAIEQLKTYADILGVPIEVIYDEQDIPVLIEKWKDADHIFIDTAGRSHKNTEQVNELITLLQCVNQKKVFLVINANTGTKDVMNIIDTYHQKDETLEIIITKLDETDEIGNLLNIAYYAQCPIAYTTSGQNVPVDIQTFNSKQYIINLLGRIEHE